MTLQSKEKLPVCLTATGDHRAWMGAWHEMQQFALKPFIVEWELSDFHSMATVES